MHGSEAQPPSEPSARLSTPISTNIISREAYMLQYDCSMLHGN